MTSNMLSDSRVTDLKNDLSITKRQVEEIHKGLGIASKVKETTDKERSELKKRFIKQYLINNPGKSEDDAKVEMNRLFKQAEEYEKSSGDDLKFWSIEKWVESSEKESNKSNA